MIPDYLVPNKGTINNKFFSAKMITDTGQIFMHPNSDLVYLYPLLHGNWLFAYD